MGLLGDTANFGKQFCKKAQTDLAVPLAKDALPKVVTNIASSAALNVINKLKKNCWKRFIKTSKYI